MPGIRPTDQPSLLRGNVTIQEAHRNRSHASDMTTLQVVILCGSEWASIDIAKPKVKNI